MNSTQLLLPGEVPMPEAPQVTLDDGTNCIPQHYLSYHHSLESVQNIVADIDYQPNYLLFVDEDASCIFIQVGIIGIDNYVASHEQTNQKIVYGRRWRVEPNLPSSEIIQTCFLALQKAREHEVRELIKFNRNGKSTTPFSCHHDLPLMAMSASTQAVSEANCLTEVDLKKLVTQLRYDEGQFTLLNYLLLDDRAHIVKLAFTPSSKTTQSDLKEQFTLHLLLNEMDENTLLYALVDALIQRSNRHVEEHFTFKQFARFSRQNSILKISDLSAKTRHKGLTEDKAEFKYTFAQNNYETDETRVPRFPSRRLGEKIRKQIAQFNIGSGILPK